jgi:hypothetical protein
MKISFNIVIATLASPILLSCNTSTDVVWLKDDKPQNGPPNFQIDPQFAKIDSERGAVLCSWMFAIEAKANSEKCHAGKNAATDEALAKSLDDIQTFVVANSDSNLSDFSASTRARIEKSKLDNICEPDGFNEKFYQSMNASGPKGIQEWTQKLLEFPRPPVLNPCL